MIEESWTLAEQVLHRWIRESTDLDGASVSWPAYGLPDKEPPCVSLSVLGGRLYAQAGSGESRSAQPVEWLATILAGPGTHTLDLLVHGEDEPFATASVTMPAETTIAAARTALLAEAVAQFDDLTVTASSINALALVGTEALMIYHLAGSETVELELVASPEQVIRSTPEDVVVSLEFRSSAVTGTGTARSLARSATNAIPDWQPLLNRAGYRFGNIVGDRPGYEADASESRHIIDIQLLGHVVDIRRPTPWVRKVRATLSSSGMPDQTIDHG